MSKLLRFLVLVIVALFLWTILRPGLSFAWTEEQTKAFQSGVRYFNTEADCDTSAAPVPSGTPAFTTGPAKPGPVYLVGDSLGTQIVGGLGAALGSGGWSFKGNAVSGRTLPEGIGAIDQDQDYIKSTTAVVVELGTNTGGFTADAVGQIVDKIRALAPTASIFWVDTVVVERQDYAQSLDAVNSIIYAQASTKNYQVISWNKKVFGDAADPLNINAAAPDNGYIRHADQFVHLSDQGVGAMTDLIVAKVTSGSTASSDTNCPSAGGAASCLVGSDNETKIWNYFIKKGLSSVQTAAIMGSLWQESGYNPLIIQGGGESQNPADAGSGGWGIAQWTPGSKIVGIAASLGITGPIYELATQLDIIWGEMNTTTPAGYNNFLADFRGMTDLAQATDFFTTKFEAAGIIGPRLENAQDILSRLGSTTPPGGTTAC